MRKKKEKITAEIVATMSLPVDRLTATDCNAPARANLLYAIGYQISDLLMGQIFLRDNAMVSFN